LFFEPKDLNKSLGFFLAKSPLLFLKIILLRYFRHTVNFANIISFILTNIFGITQIFLIARSNISFLIPFVTRIRRYTFSTSMFDSFTKNRIILVGKRFG
jgi:hypothetical protein